MRKKSALGRGIRAALAFGAGLGATAQTAVAQSEQPLGAVEQALSYYLAGGNHWRQDNQSFEPGTGTPTHWVRVMQWGPQRDVVIADAFAVYESQRCESIIHMVYRWDPELERIAVTSFGAAGLVGAGFIEPLGPERDRIVATVTLPDGSEARFRDTSDLSRRDEYSTSNERWVDGTWVPGGSARWQRTGSEATCDSIG